jgi:Asp-tRNA(Asn)/Glu-tRNA(Gln) amidotransferase A subunit family amidase
LSAAGAQVVDVELSTAIQELSTKRTIINNVERADAGAWEWHNHRSRLSHQLAECIAGGLAANRSDYRNALRLAERCRLDLDAALRGFDVLLTPAVSGEAPEGLDHTGDSTFQSLWTLLHVPTVTLPTHKGPKGLPVGIQLVGARFADGQLLRIASWVSKHLAT